MDVIRVAKVQGVVLERSLPPQSSTSTPTRQRLPGALHLTPHHLIFSPHPPTGEPSSSSASQQSSSEIWISYPTITLLTRLPQAIDGRYPLQVWTRTFNSYILSFEKDRSGGAEDVWQSVKDCAVIGKVEQLYAFFYSLPPAQPASPQATAGRSAAALLPVTISPNEPASHPVAPSPSASSSGWNTFNPRSEFARQGVGSRTKAWRFTDINRDYSFSPTYPNRLVVPSRISDSVLAYAGKYRSKARIPALTYLHWANHASITRSSQPMVGLKNSRSAQDERLVECIFSSHTSPETAYTPTTNPLTPAPTALPSAPVYGATATNLIIDARPTANAMANVAMGAGTENMENYKFGRKAYLGIDNIHVMRNSLKIIVEAVRDAETSPSGTLDRTLLRKSNWLRHTSTILDGALIIIRNVHLNASHVLIHCSDGWDRTAQLSAVAQLCLDPYYRTYDGFKVLIEKDWLAFGHKFLDRSGHLSSEKFFTVTETPEEDSEDEGIGAQKVAQAFFASVQKQFSSNSHVKEVSPVFHQFLDCVRQIQRQYPDRFEFDEDLLLELHAHLYACQFGTFVFNNERLRRTPQEGKIYTDCTVPLWDLLDRPSERPKYVNLEYKPALDDRDSREPDADQGVLFPDPKDVRFWYRLFGRGDEEMNGSQLALQQALGADVVTVVAGQVDPVSPEGIVVGPIVKGPSLENPPAIVEKVSSRSGSPAPPTSASDPDLLDKDSIRATPASSSAFPFQPPKSESSNHPAERIGRGAAAASGTGWNWSQLSSGALSAISGAAKDIKSIGQEAYQQIRAEAREVDGEMLSGGGPSVGFAPGTGVGEGRTRNTGLPSNTIPRTISRLPSETNPWSMNDATRTVRPLTNSTSTNHQPTSTQGTRRQPSWNSNPWGESPALKVQSSSPLLAELSLHEQRRMAPASITIIDEPPPADKEDKQADVEAAMGGDRKAWDPLGAL